MILETVCVGQFQVNCYILASRENAKAILIDPGDEADKINAVLNRHRLTPAFIINTHGHIDHIGCNDEFGVPVYAHHQELPLLKDESLNLSKFFGFCLSIKSEIKKLEDKENIRLDDIELEVIHTPGHTKGGICLLMKKPVGGILFTADTLFRGSIGRTDFPQADRDALIKSIKEKLLILPEETILYPGHGPSTTIGYEKKNNPFLK